MKEAEVIALLIKELEGYLGYCNATGGTSLWENPSIAGFTKYLRKQSTPQKDTASFKERNNTLLKSYEGED